MSVDIVRALQTEKPVEVSRPTQAGVRRGWEVGADIIRVRLPMWLVAAGVPVPELPAVGGLEDVPAILAMLEGLPVQGAIHCSIEARSLGQRLAAQTQAGPLAAVLTALKHAEYAPERGRRLCAVQNALERTCPMLATLAAARHEREHGTLDGFDTAPWEDATARLAADLTP